MNILGIDIGGTKTSICIGDCAGKILCQDRLPTRPERGPELVLNDIAAMAKTLLKQCNLAAPDAIGIGAPGPVNVRAGLLLSPPNMPGWDRVPLTEYFTNAFRAPVFMNNDANAAALGEYCFGYGNNASPFVFLTHSTGMGGGLIINGMLVQGANDMAGEVGHFVLDPQGPLCPCGLRGCFEAYCGGRSVELRLRARLKLEQSDEILRSQLNHNPDQLDFKTFIAAARAGDVFAAAEWRQYVERMAQGLGILIMTLNPELLVLGTIARHTGAFLMDPLQKRLPQYAWGPALAACRIQTSAIGENIGALGALALARAGLRQTNP